MRDILVTGGGGQLGIELARQSWPADVRLHCPTRSVLDIADPARVAAIMSQTDFAAVINAAAWTAVDQAETDPAGAFRANADGPGLLAGAAAAAGIPIVHVSTDYVFDGRKGAAYAETDAPVPIGRYGASKRAGEVAVLAGARRSVVIRTAWLVSAHGRNFLTTILRLARAGSPLRVVDDQIGSPTSAWDLAGAIKTVALRMIDDAEAPTGLFHFVNAGEASWHGLAQEIVDIAGLPTRVDPIASADYPTPVARPADSRLATARITADYGLHPRDWRAAIRDIIDELAGPVPQTGA